MEYQVVKAINNNVILAKEVGSSEQVMLRSKGIGFHRKSGDSISDQMGYQEIFKFWNKPNMISHTSYDFNQLEQVVRQIVEQVHQRMGVEPDLLYQPLLDHISFSLDRINFGLPLDNPYGTEISVLYSMEYSFAKLAVEHIRKELGVDLGENEVGLMALHFNTARKRRTMSVTMERVNLFNAISTILEEQLELYGQERELELRIFLLSLNNMLHRCSNGEVYLMPCKRQVFVSMKESYEIAKEISTLIEAKIGIHLNDDCIAYLTVEVQKIV